MNLKREKKRKKERANKKELKDEAAFKKTNPNGVSDYSYVDGGETMGYAKPEKTYKDLKKAMGVPKEGLRPKEHPHTHGWVAHDLRKALGR